jgi:hypothetical protein
MRHRFNYHGFKDHGINSLSRWTAQIALFTLLQANRDSSWISLSQKPM